MCNLLKCVIFSFLIFGCASHRINGTQEKSLDTNALTDLVIRCKYCVGYEGAGGACHSGAGGVISKIPGGNCYDGPGGPLHTGPGGRLSIHPGGLCSESPGGNCYSGPGSDGKNCSLACRLNKK